MKPRPVRIPNGDDLISSIPPSIFEAEKYALVHPFKYLLASKNIDAINQYWNENAKLRDYYDNHDNLSVTSAMPNPIYIISLKVSWRDLQEDFALMLSSKSVLVIEAVWNRNPKLQIAFSNYIVGLKTAFTLALESGSNLIAEYMIDAENVYNLIQKLSDDEFKLLLTSVFIVQRNRDFIAAIFNLINRKSLITQIAEEITQQKISLTGDNDPDYKNMIIQVLEQRLVMIDLDNCVEDFRAALLSDNVEAVKKLWLDWDLRTWVKSFDVERAEKLIHEVLSFAAKSPDKLDLFVGEFLHFNNHADASYNVLKSFGGDSEIADSATEFKKVQLKKYLRFTNYDEEVNEPSATFFNSLQPVSNSNHEQEEKSSSYRKRVKHY